MEFKRVPGAGEKELQVLLKAIESTKVGKVGWFEGNKYPDKAHTPVAQVAAINEYGAGHTPARPFMRPTVVERRDDWQAIANSEARKMLKGESTVEEALDRIGLRASGDIRRTISRIWSPPLSPRTIYARLHARKIADAPGISSAYAKGTLNPAQTKSLGNLTKPLVDTRQLINTLINTVEDE